MSAIFAPSRPALISGTGSRALPKAALKKAAISGPNATHTRAAISAVKPICSSSCISPARNNAPVRLEKPANRSPNSKSSSPQRRQARWNSPAASTGENRVGTKLPNTGTNRLNRLMPKITAKNTSTARHQSTQLVATSDQARFHHSQPCPTGRRRARPTVASPGRGVSSNAACGPW